MNKQQKSDADDVLEARIRKNVLDSCRTVLGQMFVDVEWLKKSGLDLKASVKASREIPDEMERRVQELLK